MRERTILKRMAPVLRAAGFRGSPAAALEVDDRIGTIGVLMGLDWNPLARPKPGSEAEFATLVQELDSGRTRRGGGLLLGLLGVRRLSAREKKALLERFRAISEEPYVTLGAPRAGFDAAADEWLAAKLEAKGRLGDHEEVRQQMQGYYVLDLLPPCDGFPLYTNYPAYEGLDRYSFRAQFLNQAADIIGPELHEQAWNRKLAPELLAYADALESRARDWAARAGVLHLEQATEAPPGGEGDPASQAHILFSAIRWCRFWGKRGHGLEPYY